MYRAEVSLHSVSRHTTCMHVHVQYSSHVTSRASASDSHLNCERVTFYTRA